MSIVIDLLGPPRISRDGEQQAGPRGRKAWALLAYLACTDGATTRERIATFLFDGADDPMRALRWNLTEIRRCLGSDATVEGDPPTLRLAPATVVDVHVLRRGTWIAATSLDGLGKDLLEGIDPASSAAFQSWLLSERRHLKATSAAILREAALAHLAAGHAEAAVDSAVKLVAIDPFDEAHQALLIRCYATAGDDPAAARQLAACVELFRRELGVEPSGAVTAALRSPHYAPAVAVSGIAAAEAQLEAGNAAMKAGALDAAIDCFRRAAAEARASGEIDLHARTLFAMGSALVHSGRGRYEEGVVVLHDAITVAERAGNDLVAAGSHREIAWAELLAARYTRVAVWLERAASLAKDDRPETARIAFVSGMALTEMARYPEALTDLHRSLSFAEAEGDAKQTAITMAMLGKAHLLRREMTEARDYMEKALDLIRQMGWTWLTPWPEAYLAELELLEGNVTRAEEMFEHALAMALHIGDPCFQCKSEAGLGLVDAARGRPQQALQRLASARARLLAVPDHTWTLGHALDALCALSVEHAPGLAERWIGDLETLAARTGMKEYLVRAYLHRHGLGDPDALDTARLLGAEIDNPRLHDELAVAPMP